MSSPGGAGVDGINLAINDTYASMRVVRNNNGSSDGMYIGYGNGNSGLTRIYGGGSTTSAMVRYSTYTEHGGSDRAPVFYDTDNTAYYFDGAASTAININGGITFAAANPYITASSYFVCPGGAYFNSGTVYTEANIKARGGVGNDTAAALTLTGGTGGYTQIDGSARSPLFYDTNNTGYYWNFADGAVSNLSTYISGNVYYRSNPGSGVYLGSTTNPPLQVFSDDGGAAYMTFHRSGAYAFNMGLDPDNYFRWGGWSASANRFIFDIGNGWGQAANSWRAPLFYDQDNTAYYGNFAGTSVMSSIALGGSTSVPQGAMWINGDIWTTGNSRKLAFSTDGSSDSTPNGSIRCDGTGAGDVVIQNWSGSASNDNFWVFGSSRDAACAGNITAYYSDERLKTKTGVITNALDKVKSLEGFTYIENELARSVGYNNDKQQVGLSAQKVQAVLPEAVALAPFDYERQEDGTMGSKSGENYLTVDYSRLVPLLIEAIKEQQTHINKLEARINQLETK
jgi:hypothetical protein